MANSPDTFLSGSNIDFIEGLYARWLEDPASVDPSWRELFAGTATSGRPLLAANGNGPTVARPATRSNGNGQGAVVQTLAPVAAPVSRSAMQLQARVDQTLYAFRLRGHLLAQIDPLGRPRAPVSHVADLAMASNEAFTAEELEQEVDSSDVDPGHGAG